MKRNYKIINTPPTINYINLLKDRNIITHYQWDMYESNPQHYVSAYENTDYYYVPNFKVSDFVNYRDTESHLKTGMEIEFKVEPSKMYEFLYTVSSIDCIVKTEWPDLLECITHIDKFENNEKMIISILNKCDTFIDKNKMYGIHIHCDKRNISQVKLQRLKHRMIKKKDIYTRWFGEETKSTQYHMISNFGRFRVSFICERDSTYEFRFVRLSKDIDETKKRLRRFYRLYSWLLAI